jgi:peroxiredoxin
VSADDRSDLDATRERMRLTYPMVSDPDLEIARAWGVREKWRNAALPATFVVGEDGRVRFVHVATNPIDRSSVTDLLAVLRR